MHESLKDEVTRAWSDAWDHGDFAAFERLVAPNYRRESTGSGRTSSFAEFEQEIREVRAAFPDLATRIEQLIVEADSLAIFWTSEGTFTEPLGTVPPTGKRVVTRGSNFSTLLDGRIAHERVTWDSSELLTHLGLPSLHSAFEEADEDYADETVPAPREMLKAFNKQFVSGVTVVTTIDDEGQPRGLAVSAYTSVSLDPPLVIVCVQKTSSSYPALFRSTNLGINILSSEQRDTLSVFASKSPDKFATVAWHAAPAGSPLIDGSSASIEVEIKERFQALTHTIFVGRVHHAETTEAAPILYKAGAFYDGRGLSAL
ncbi:flavin reductase [Agrococcus sp. TSP3-2-1]|uniref:flavin reductase n=1 Tax=Agrococcus sp. TSP3-2-1 TaxID=2804583 RepID=UPI003CEC102F